jgi:hypothetical protein
VEPPWDLVHRGSIKNARKQRGLEFNRSIARTVATQMFKKSKTSFAEPHGVRAGDIDAHTACAAARVF